MRKIATIIAGLLGAVALTLTGATAVTAAPPANAAAVTITFDADGSGLPTAAAATDWSKNTNITVLAGECTTGINCVHFKLADFPCGRGAPVGGCAYGIADCSCQVEVGRWIFSSGPNREYLDDLIVKHEGGHCIFRAGGISQSFHIADSRALMSAVQSSSPTRQQATLTSIDRSFTRDLFS